MAKNSENTLQEQWLEWGIRQLNHPTGLVTFQVRVYHDGKTHTKHLKTLEEARDYRTSYCMRHGKLHPDRRPVKVKAEWKRQRHDFGIFKTWSTLTGLEKWIVRLRIPGGSIYRMFDNIVDAYLYRSTVFTAYGRPGRPLRGNPVMAETHRLKVQAQKLARLNRLATSQAAMEWRDAA